MIEQSARQLTEELQDLERPQYELTPEEAAHVQGGFDPQPDPPCRWSNAALPSANLSIVAAPQINVRQSP